MFSIHNRGELNPVTEHEFENFNSRLKGLWLAEHNEDGSHISEIARTDVANVFQEEQQIANGQLLRIKYSGERSTRYGPAALTDNVSYDPAVGWNLDDTTTAGAIETLDSNGFNFYTVPAGANPRIPVQALGIDASNVLQLYKGQLKFPGTQNASADANVLDDYEEGTWTPTIGGSTSETGQVYTTNLGCYVKIGKKVHITAVITLSTLGTITGNVQLKGLPFAVGAANADRGMCSTYWGSLTTPLVYLTAVAEASTTIATVYAATAATVGLGGLVQANLSNTSAFVFTTTYRAAA